jgi:hypothetical protein
MQKQIVSTSEDHALKNCIIWPLLSKKKDGRHTNDLINLNF